MMRSQTARKKLSATDIRSLRTLVLVEVLELADIGLRIQKARIEAGLRQEDLAPLINVSTRTLQSYEGGSPALYRKIREIATITGRPVEWLLHGDPPEPTDLAGQGVALVLDRLEGLEVKLEEQGRETVRAVEALQAGIERLENRQDDGDHREHTP